MERRGESVVFNLMQMGAPKAGQWKQIICSTAIDLILLVDRFWSLLSWRFCGQPTCLLWNLDITLWIYSAVKRRLLKRGALAVYVKQSDQLTSVFPRSSEGYSCASFDRSLNPGRRVMDILSPPGILLLSKKFQVSPWNVQHLLRLVLHTALCLFPDSVCLMGPCCASWGLPARFTSMRSYINPFGAMHLPFVADANQTISLNLGWKSSIWGCPFITGVVLRVTMLCFVLLAKQCYFILEHPAQTLLIRHKRWEYFMNCVAFAPLLQ